MLFLKATIPSIFKSYFKGTACTALVLRMAHRKWKESKQEPGTAGPGNMLGCCLVSFRFLRAILSTSTVLVHGREDKKSEKCSCLCFACPFKGKGKKGLS